MTTERKPIGYWKNLENRINETKKLVESTGRNPEELTQKDFYEHEVGGLLSACGSSPYAALKEAGYDIKPWQMKNGVPRNYFDAKENRIAAVKWLVKKTRKGASKINTQDFDKNNLVGILHFHNSLSAVMKEAGYDYQPSTKMRGYWENPENRIKAVREVVEKLGKKPDEITHVDFKKNGLRGVLSYCSYSVPAALKEAGYAIVEKEKIARRDWDLENRVNAIKEVAQKAGKDLRELTGDDFEAVNIKGMLDGYYRGSVYAALKEAGLAENIQIWEMKNLPKNYWLKKSNRVDAVKRLLKKIGKRPREITAKDFHGKGEHGLINVYNNSPYAALKEAGYSIEPWEMKGGVPKNYWTEKENRVWAIKWLVEKTGKKQLKIKDFQKYGLNCILKYCNRSIYAALKEASLVNYPWECSKVPNGYWNAEQNRIDAIRWLVDNSGKAPNDIKLADFENVGFYRVLYFYKRSIPLALKAAGYNVNAVNANKTRNPATDATELLKLYITGNKQQTKPQTEETKPQTNEDKNGKTNS